MNPTDNKDTDTKLPDIELNYIKQLDESMEQLNKLKDTPVKLSEVDSLKKKIEDKEKEHRDLRVKMIDEIENLKLHTRVCTCDSGNTGNPYLKCRKHPSRFFKNTGCYWCYYSDCSNYGC